MVTDMDGGSEERLWWVMRACKPSEMVSAAEAELQFTAIQLTRVLAGPDTELKRWERDCLI